MDVHSLLPLPPITFHILLALAEEDLHGYAIIQNVAARTGGELKIGAGTLYRSIQRMLDQGLVVETRERSAPADDDERRRYYRITEFGRHVARSPAITWLPCHSCCRDRARCRSEHCGVCAPRSCAASATAFR